jgi:hypothetical protein
VGNGFFEREGEGEGRRKEFVSLIEKMNEELEAERGELGKKEGLEL